MVGCVGADLGPPDHRGPVRHPHRPEHAPTRRSTDRPIRSSSRLLSDLSRASELKHDLRPSPTRWPELVRKDWEVHAAGSRRKLKAAIPNCSAAKSRKVCCSGRMILEYQGPDL